jgi:histidine triad (HIT) family protein
MNDCVFCKIICGRSPGSFVYRDEVCTAFLDINPINPGHILVVPNIHVASVSDLSDEQTENLLKVGRNILNAIKNSSIKSEGANFFISDGEMAGQEVPHTHLHIVPRFTGDKQRFGFSHTSAKREDLELIAEKIKEQL